VSGTSPSRVRFSPLGDSFRCGIAVALVLACVAGSGGAEEPPRAAAVEAAVAAAAPQPGANDRHIAVAVRRHLER